MVILILLFWINRYLCFLKIMCFACLFQVIRYNYLEVLFIGFDLAFSVINNSEKGERRFCIMATSSITHNFVINDRMSAEKFAEALDKPEIQKADVKVETVNGADNVKLLAEKWKTGMK